MNASSGIKFFKDKWIVEVEFWDHVATIGGVSKPILCQVYGVLFAEDEKSLYVANWIADRRIDSNTDSHTLIKKTKVKMVKFSKRKVEIDGWSD